MLASTSSLQTIGMQQYIFGEQRANSNLEPFSAKRKRGTTTPSPRQVSLHNKSSQRTQLTLKSKSTKRLLISIGTAVPRIDQWREVVVVQAMESIAEFEPHSEASHPDVLLVQVYGLWQQWYCALDTDTQDEEPTHCCERKGELPKTRIFLAAPDCVAAGGWRWCWQFGSSERHTFLKPQY